MPATHNNWPVKDLVSTIIPVFNRPDMLRQAVQSVLSQTYRPIEIIISDDGSTDQTCKIADELAEKHPDEIRVIHNPNQGPGPGREAGRQMARGEFIQYLDSDDRLAPRKFEIQVAALRRNPDCGVAYGMTHSIDQDGNEVQKSLKLTGQPLETLFPRLLVDRWWCTHTPLYRRSICDQVGPWSDLRYSQDWEYDGRVGALGTKLAFCPEHVSDHRTHEGARQTGSGKWLLPQDQVRFFESLLRSAKQAGVAEYSAEMMHFVRWVFASSRYAACQTDIASAKFLLNLAMQASTPCGLSLRTYNRLCSILGWRFTAQFLERARTLAGKRPGKATIRQSWMQAPCE